MHLFYCLPVAPGKTHMHLWRYSNDQEFFKSGS